LKLIYVIIFDGILLQKWEAEQRERIENDLKLVQNGKEKDAVINWLVAERWDHKKTNDEKVEAKKDKVNCNF